MDWTEIIITVNTGAVESVANFIHESGAGGVVLEHKDNKFSTVTAYFPVGEETDSLLARFENFMSTLEEIGIKADSQVRTSTIAEQDWAEEWKKHYRAVQIGTIVISPSWLEPPSDPGLILVRLDPGMAFGTGTHPTTQMCIKAISDTLSPTDAFLDLGSGSAILSIVAAKLGAARVDAVDCDRVAVDVAAENARLNQSEINPFLGDAFAYFKECGHNLVVANIGFSACAKLADLFVAENKDCTLILSGFPEERMEEMLSHAGSGPALRHYKDGWGCLILQRQ